MVSLIGLGIVVGTNLRRHIMGNRTALVRDFIAGSLSAMCIDWMDTQKSSDFKVSASLKL
jgi:hypothetical protein